MKSVLDAKVPTGQCARQLYQRGFIDDPVNKSKSLWLTDEGVRESERLFMKLFTKNAAQGSGESQLLPSARAIISFVRDFSVRLTKRGR
ncbi:hypothetical protein CDO44_10105 [Pigmentiphaga sp. NML080357]|uniref:DUF6429 family protein n=1 Tax=Pigmentiphaga sp. NML080357 TaxID=2008675 RepID=UPI000B40ADB7|nr:hypothetical protein CDO44_10105 [Pigmentiphaga sp. NML080357]